MNAQDFILILKDALTSVPFVLPVVIALVQWVKSVTKTSDERILNLCAMVFGVLLGGAFMLAVRIPTTYPQWFMVVFFGIVLGLSASGLFKVGQQMATASLVNVATTTTQTTVSTRPDTVVTNPVASIAGDSPTHL